MMSTGNVERGEEVAVDETRCGPPTLWRAALRCARDRALGEMSVAINARVRQRVGEADGDRSRAGADVGDDDGFVGEVLAGERQRRVPPAFQFQAGG